MNVAAVARSAVTGTSGRSPAMDICGRTPTARCVRLISGPSRQQSSTTRLRPGSRTPRTVVIRCGSRRHGSCSGTRRTGRASASSVTTRPSSGWSGPARSQAATLTVAPWIPAITGTGDQGVKMHQKMALPRVGGGKTFSGIRSRPLAPLRAQRRDK